jgi:hypothetical protein
MALQSHWIGKLTVEPKTFHKLAVLNVCYKAEDFLFYLDKKKQKKKKLKESQT